MLSVGIVIRSRSFIILRAFASLEQNMLKVHEDFSGVPGVAELPAEENKAVLECFEAAKEVRVLPAYNRYGSLATANHDVRAIDTHLLLLLLSRGSLYLRHCRSC